MSNSSDISPQKQGLLKAMDDNMNENSIDIDVSAGDASFRGEDGTAMIISDDMADTGTQDTEDASVLSDGRISPPSDQDIINSIQGNIKNPDSAETMQTDLITGMSALIDIETRLKSDSGNINSKSIDISASHSAYMDFNTERGTIADSPAKLAKLGEAAQAMARDIRTAVETGRLTGTEVNQLLGVLTGLTGDADLAAAYIGIDLHDIGTRATDIGKSATDIGKIAAEASVDSMQGAGDNGIGIGSGARNRANLDQDTVDRILSTRKGKRPDPSTYFDQDHIDKHLSVFYEGVAKIKANPPKDVEGVGLGTFVMPKSIADEAIAMAGGDFGLLEVLLTLDQGSLGDHPVRLDIPNPKNLRLPSGNEVGAFPGYWIPGGYTKGGIIEAIIDPVLPGEYIVTPLT